MRSFRKRKAKHGRKSLRRKGNKTKRLRKYGVSRGGIRL